MAKIHFISGLPRSGSTLLAALLRQNPRFQVGMSGPLAGLFGALLGQMSVRMLPRDALRLGQHRAVGATQCPQPVVGL